MNKDLDDFGHINISKINKAESPRKNNYVDSFCQDSFSGKKMASAMCAKMKIQDQDISSIHAESSTDDIGKINENSLRFHPSNIETDRMKNFHKIPKYKPSNMFYNCDSEKESMDEEEVETP